MVGKEGPFNAVGSSDLVWIVPVAALGLALALIVVMLGAFPVLGYILKRYRRFAEGLSTDMTPKKDEEEPERPLVPYVLPEPSSQSEPFVADARLGLAFLGLEDIRVDVVVYPEWNEGALRRDGLREPEPSAPFRLKDVSLAAFVRRPWKMLGMACHVPYLDGSIRTQVVVGGSTVSMLAVPAPRKSSSLWLGPTFSDEVRLKWFFFSRLDPGGAAALDIPRIVELCAHAGGIAAMTKDPDERREVRDHLFQALGKVCGYDFSIVDIPEEGRPFRSMLSELCYKLVPMDPLPCRRCSPAAFLFAVLVFFFRHWHAPAMESTGSTRMVLTPDAVEACRALQKRHGKSYYLATRFFPEDLQLATYALYAFFRIPDEIVDAAGADPAKARADLLAWKSRWSDAYAGLPTDDPVMRAAAAVCRAYAIPFEYTESFLEAMLQDTVKDRYATYAELESYMYGSAAVVGLMMTHVIGHADVAAFAYARRLGEAMQLTNFLRDIREDLETRGRIYLPQDELARFGITEAQLRGGRSNRAWKQFMKFQIARADELYAKAEIGIPMLDVRGRRAVRIASRLYQQILRQIERQRYDVFAGRAVVPMWRKWLILAKEIFFRRSA
jgi:phytoene synthase